MIRFIDLILRYVSLIGASMLTLPLSVILLSSAFPGAAYIMPPLALAFAFLGYFLQSMNARLQHKKASLDGFSSLTEGTLSEFKSVYAAIPITLLVVVSVPLMLGFDLALRAMCDSGFAPRYDLIYTVFFGFIFLLSSIIGVVIWFYPVQRLSNIYVLMGGAAIFYVESFFVALYASAYPKWIIALPLVLFTICVLLIFNQSNLQKQYRGSVVSVMTPTSRLYNVFLVFMLFVLFIASAYVIYVMLSGIWIIIKAVIYVLLYKILRNQTDSSDYDIYSYVDSDEASSQFRRSVMPSGDANVFTVFLIFIVLALILYVGIRKGYLIKLFVRIREWIQEVISTFLIGKDIFKNSFDPNATEEIINYKDEVKRIQNAAIRDYDSMADATDDYKTFLRELGKLNDYDSQLCYSYSVLLKMYKKMNIALKSSDTPREIEKKVERSVSKAEINRITADYEKLRYAEVQVTDIEAKEILENICGEIKRYMY